MSAGEHWRKNGLEKWLLKGGFVPRALAAASLLSVMAALGGIGLSASAETVTPEQEPWLEVTPEERQRENAEAEAAVQARREQENANLRERARAEQRQKFVADTIMIGGIAVLGGAVVAVGVVAGMRYANKKNNDSNGSKD